MDEMPLLERINMDNVRAVAVYVDCTTDDQGWEHNAWKVTLKRKGRQMTVPYKTGLGITGVPTACDVLACVLSDVHGYEIATGFRDWAEEYGYDSDSIGARETYGQIERQAEQLRRFLRGGVRVHSAIRKYLYETDWQI